MLGLGARAVLECKKERGVHVLQISTNQVFKLSAVTVLILSTQYYKYFLHRILIKSVSANVKVKL